MYYLNRRAGKEDTSEFAHTITENKVLGNIIKNTKENKKITFNQAYD